MSTAPAERQAAITGIGQSAVGRHLGRGELDLTLDACVAAIADAGLTREDIDGLATYPGAGIGMGGFGGPGTPDVQDALRLRLNWHDGGSEGPAQMRAVIAACFAIAAGAARHVLVYRTVTESTAQGSGGRQGIGGSGGGSGGGPVSPDSCSGRSPSEPSRPSTGWPSWRSDTSTSSGSPGSNSARSPSMPGATPA